MPILFFNKNAYTLILTNHLYEKRGMYYRNSLLTEKAIKNIVIHSLINGLTSFRDKGKVKVHTMVYDGSSTTLLLELTGSTITIITAFKTRHLFYTAFSKVNQSIFIRNYIIPKITEKEMQKHNITNSFKRTDISEDIHLWNKYKGLF